jgi:thioredoxin-related protein
MNFLELSVVSAWVVLIVQSIIIFYLSKFVAGFLNGFRVTGDKVTKPQLSVGEKAPLFRENDHTRIEVKLNENKGKYTLLLFANKDCTFCKEIIPKLPILNKYLDLRLVVISMQQLNIKNMHSNEIHFIESKELFKSYFISGVPHLILIDPKTHVVLTESLMSFHQLSIILGNYFRKNINYEEKII